MAKSYFPTLFGPRADDGRLFRSLKRDVDRVFRDFDHVGFPVFHRHGDVSRGDFALYPSVDVVESDESVELWSSCRESMSMIWKSRPLAARW